MLMSFGAGALTSGLGLHFFKKSDSQENQKLQKENEKLQNENNTLQSENKTLKEQKNNSSPINTQELNNLQEKNQILQREVNTLKQENEHLKTNNIPIPTVDTTNQQEQKFRQALASILRELNTVEGLFGSK